MKHHPHNRAERLRLKALKDKPPVEIPLRVKQKDKSDVDIREESLAAEIEAHDDQYKP